MSKRLMFPCKVKSSSVEEDKDTGTSKVTTKISGMWYNGLYQNFNKDLEEVLREKEFWKAINSEITGTWKMIIADRTSGQVIGEITECKIKNINVNRVNDDMITTSIKITHPYTKAQTAIESSISTEINVELIVDSEVFSGEAKLGVEENEDNDDSTRGRI